MTYTEWRDELKSNLLSASDDERRRVLEYYAEAYADRREAGFSETKIIEEFGAPYDAARRILSEIQADDAGEPVSAKAPDETAPQAAPEPAKGEDGGETEEEHDAPASDGDDEQPSKNKSGGKKRMSKGKKALIIVGAVLSGLFAAALVVFIVGVALNDWQVVTKYSQNEYTCEADITALNIEGTVGGMEIKQYDGDKAYVVYPTSKRFFVTVTEQNGTLIVKGPQNSFPFWGYLNIPDTVIMLPRDKVCDLDVKVKAGGFKLSDGTFNNCKFDVSAGSLEIGKIKCAAAQFTVSAGSTEVKGIDSASIKINVSAGDFEGDNVIADKIDVDVSAGSVELELAGKQEEYTVIVDKSAGSCNVNAQKGTTDKVIDVSVSAGSVELKFKH